MAQQTGTVVRIVTDKETGQRKGFGFVRDDKTGDEYFFHKSGLLSRFVDLNEGDRVSYDVGEGPQGKGPRAVDVRVI